MADLQQILGTMLATGMGGRSGRNTDHIGGMLGGGGLGGSGMLGMGAGRGGPSFKQTAGLAALGYLAYRAFQERQRNQAAAGGGTPQPGGSPWGGAQGGQTGGQTGTSSGGILGSIFGGGAASGGGSLAERLSGIFQTRAQAPTVQNAPSGRGEGAFPELAMEDQQALLLIRAMITAANADGVISPEERRSVLAALDEAGAGPEERRIVEHELDHPQPVDTLLQQVRDPQTAEQVYMASVMSVAEQSEAERAYLQYLASRLNIDPQRLRQIRGAA